jgi:hypothetical protein
VVAVSVDLQKCSPLAEVVIGRCVAIAPLTTSRCVCVCVCRSYFGDLVRAWWVIVICGILIAVAFSFLWVVLMKFLTACMVRRRRCTSGPSVPSMAVLCHRRLTPCGSHRRCGPPSSSSCVSASPSPSSATSRVRTSRCRCPCCPRVMSCVPLLNAEPAGILKPSQFERFTDGLSEERNDKIQDNLGQSEVNKVGGHARCCNVDGDADVVVLVGGSAAGQDKFRIAAYIFTGITIIIICIIMAIRKSISTAIKVIKLGTRALTANLSMLVFPLFVVALLVSLLVRRACMRACRQPDVVRCTRRRCPVLGCRGVSRGVSRQATPLH